MDGSRPRWFGVGLNPTPSFLLCTSCRAVCLPIPIPAFCPHFLVPVPSLISLVSSQLPPPPAPPTPHHGFLLLLLPLTPALVGASVSMKPFPPSHFLGKSSSTRRAGSPLPVQVPGVGARGVAAAGSRDLAQGWASVHVRPPGAAGGAGFAQSWRNSDGKSKTLPGPKITFLTDFKALFQNIWACTKKPRNNK